MLGCHIKDPQREIISSKYPMIFPAWMVSHCLWPLLISNCKFRITTVPQIDSRKISWLSFSHEIETLPYTRSLIVFPSTLELSQSNSYNSIVHEKMLRKKNMQLPQLQLYINNIARCLGILDLLSAKRKYHQWNNLIKCYTIFTSHLSTNFKNSQQDYDLQTKRDQSTSSTKKYY